MFLKKEKDPLQQIFDCEWIRSLTEAHEIATESQKIALPMTKGKLTLKKSVPSRWEVSAKICLQALNEGEIAALTAAMRQLGVGSQGGTEALKWASRTLDTPLARIKVDEKNCFE